VKPIRSLLRVCFNSRLQVGRLQVAGYRLQVGKLMSSKACLESCILCLWFY